MFYCVLKDLKHRLYARPLVEKLHQSKLPGFDAEDLPSAGLATEGYWLTWPTVSAVCLVSTVLSDK